MTSKRAKGSNYICILRFNDLDPPYDLVGNRPMMRPPNGARASISLLITRRKGRGAYSSTMWSDEAWKAISKIYDGIIDLDFVRELGEGTLSEDRFVEYMVQDKLYLADYARALALIAARAPTPEDTAQWSQFSLDAAAAESTLHDFYLNHFEVSDEMRQQLKLGTKNIACELYTSYLLKHASLSSLGVAVAAVLPCFWVYDAVGKHHVGMLKRHGDHKYAKWIELYSSEDFTTSTNTARAFCDRLAEQASPEEREKMTEVFVRGSLLELMFWKASWVHEKWLY